MRAPDFWRAPGSLLSDCLVPFGALYAFGAAARLKLTPGQQVGVPVICVGNLVAGGAGKTPVVLDLLYRLNRKGRKPHGLSRGYGGSLAGPALVDRPEPSAFGDEPVLLARAAPCWIARDRLAGARQAVAAGAGCIVMDDGFQNPTLLKDLSLLVVDGRYGFGNGRVMPAGPLREPIGAGLARADAVVVMGADEAGIASIVKGKPLLEAQVEAATTTPAWSGRRVFALAGIARPEKFHRTLRGIGADVVGTRDFPDHHAYSRPEVEAVIAEAEGLNACPVTTEKDWVRLPPDLASRIEALPVRLAWSDGGVGIERLLGDLFG